MGHVGFIWALRAVVLLGFPAAFVAIWLHPGLALAVAAGGVPLVSGSAIVLMKKIGPLHQCPGRHQGRRVLRATIADNQRRLDQYDRLFRLLGLDPPGTPRREGLRLIHSRHQDSRGRAAS